MPVLTLPNSDQAVSDGAGEGLGLRGSASRALWSASTSRRATRRCWSSARRARARRSSPDTSTRSASRGQPFVAVNCGAFSASAGRERALRAREGRLHRRRGARRAGSRRPRAARCSWTRSAICRAAAGETAARAAGARGRPPRRRTSIPVDVRLIAATNVDLEGGVAPGSFAKISSIGCKWRCCPFRRCASARATSCPWRIISWRFMRRRLAGRRPARPGGGSAPVRTPGRETSASSRTPSTTRCWSAATVTSPPRTCILATRPRWRRRRPRFRPPTRTRGEPWNGPLTPSSKRVAARSTRRSRTRSFAPPTSIANAISWRRPVCSASAGTSFALA